jgi:CHAT domain-containing protein
MLREDATTLLGARATAPALRDAIEPTPPRYLHLATHGLTGSRARPSDASLALTQPETPTPDDIGFLTLEELTSGWFGRLDGTDLVTLSACDTGRGQAIGDSVMSLPLGFFAAGAETVVASLWKVDDTATTLLMTRFYANLLGRTGSARTIDGDRYGAGESLPKLAALREAQAWLRSLTRKDLRGLRGAEEIAAAASRGAIVPRPAPSASADSDAASERAFDHPYYWAAFVLYGDPGISP